MVSLGRILLGDGESFAVKKLEGARCESFSADFVKLFCKVVLIIKLLISNQQSAIDEQSLSAAAAKRSK